MMKQNDGIAYEKPELIAYSLYGVVNGTGGDSQGGNGPEDEMNCSDFIDD